MRARLSSRCRCAAMRSTASFPSSLRRLRMVTVFMPGRQVTAPSARCWAHRSGSRSASLPIGGSPEGQRNRRYSRRRFTVSPSIGRRRALPPLPARTVSVSARRSRSRSCRSAASCERRPQSESRVSSARSRARAVLSGCAEATRKSHSTASGERPAAPRARGAGHVARPQGYG